MKSSRTFTTIKDLIVRLASLYVENAKLNIAEKLTLVLSAALLLIVALVLGIFALAFFTGAALEALELVMEPWLSYLIMGCVFVGLIIVAVLLRKTLFVNPIARYLSKVIFDEPA